MFKVASLTDRGLKRTNNEDSIFVDKESGLFVVSDGMGGYERGDVASKIIVDCFEKSFSCVDDDETLPGLSEDLEGLEERLNRIIKESTDSIIEYAKSNSIDRQMGATVVGLYKVEDREDIAVFHLGDSRGYRIRDERLDRITRDHSKYEEMRESGLYREDELAKVGRNQITKAVGNFRVFPLEINYISLEDNDTYMLCSDGVSDLCSDEELLNIIVENHDNLDAVCHNIKKLVYDRGAKDNLSIIIFIYKRR